MKGKKLFLLTMAFIVCIYSLAQDKVFRVAHFNMGQLSMGKKNHTVIQKHERDSKILLFKQLFNRIDADFFCICEYAPYFSLLPDSSENVKDLTKDAILRKYKYHKSCNRSYKNCNSIFSRKKKLKNFEVVKYSQGKGRCYVVADVMFGENVVKFVETHLDVSKMKEFREIQIKELLAAFQNEKNVIICGDFNVASINEYDLFKENGYTLANCEDFGQLITFPYSKGGACFDNIMCKGFNISNVQVFDTNLSDHYAIACDLQIQD